MLNIVAILKLFVLRLNGGITVLWRFASVVRTQAIGTTS